MQCLQYIPYKLHITIKPIQITKLPRNHLLHKKLPNYTRTYQH